MRSLLVVLGGGVVVATSFAAETSEPAIPVAPAAVSPAADVAAPAAVPVDPALSAWRSGLDDPAQAATGLVRLSSEQLTVLDTQVTRELRLAREGDVRGFAGTFSSRRTPAERVASGLEMFSPAERAALDDLIALRLAERPAIPLVRSRRPVTDADGFTLVRRKRELEVHGEVSLFYGWGSGDRSYYGADTVIAVSDPDHRFTAMFGYSTVRGDLPSWDCGYGPGYYGRRH